MNATESPRRGGRLVLALLAVILTTACSPVEPDPGPEEGEQEQEHGLERLAAELSRQRRKWRAQGIDSYTFTVQRVCFCWPEVTRPVVVRVVGGAVAERTYAESGEPVDSKYVRLWPSVEGLFDLLQDGIDRKAHAIRVQYHSELGYPTEAFIDYEAHMADEEQGFSARDLLPVR